jgi:putative copper export protein
VTTTDRVPHEQVVVAPVVEEEVVGSAPGGPVPPRVWLLAGAATVVALSALVVGLGSLLAAPDLPGLPQAGVVTDVGLVVTRVAARVLAVVVVGTLLLAAVLVPAPRSGGAGRLPAPDAVSRRATAVGAAAAAGWAGTALVGAAFDAARLTATPVQVLPVEVLVPFLLEVPSGRAAAGVAVLSTLVMVSAVSLRGRGAPVARLLAAVAALVLPQVLSGHSATAPDHALAVLLLSVHVVVATAWVGGLGALVVLARRSDVLPVAAARFSTLALVCFVATGTTGAAAAWVVLGGADAVPGLLATGYGMLLGAKTVAFVALGVAGWWHRRRTLPALRRGTPRAFLLFAAGETAVLLLATALAVTLAGTAPAAPAGGTSAPVPGAAADLGDAPGTPAPAPSSAPASGTGEDMSGHDHGDLTVSVLVDPERYHVAGPVLTGQRVTVFNGSDRTVTLTAQDGSFDVEVASRSLTTFVAPSQAGSYAFRDRGTERYSDVLVVEAP